MNVLGDMKNKIFTALLMDADIVKLVTDSPTVTLPAMELRYTSIIPWKKTPDTRETAQTLITFEIGIGAEVSPAVRWYNIYIRVLTHDSLMRFDKQAADKLGLTDRGTRIDVLAEKIDYLINGSKELGLGKVQTVESTTFDTVGDYHGRGLMYAVQGPNRQCDRL